MTLAKYMSLASVLTLSACQSIDNASLHIPANQVNDIERCQIVDGDGWSVKETLHVSACNYRVQNIEYNFLDLFTNLKIRTTVGVNGFGFTWDEDGDIVSYKFGSKQVHVDKEGNFAGLIIDGQGVTRNDIDKYTKDFAFTTQLPNGELAHSACFYISKAQVVSFFDDNEEVFGYTEKPDEILTCQGTIGEALYQTRWHSKDNKFALLINDDMTNYQLTQPTRYLLDGQVFDLPGSMALCIEQNDLYQACLAEEQPADHIYLQYNEDDKQRGALLTSLFAFKIIDAIDKP
ncbi:hypothetical protein QWY77_13615 [Thalassotalea ponticola]|uniref:hypothetical protein n=1 Tax=Thalassotalea ponticola TaxID=1523392 RepID=UPI0025B46074|nr:hypothetical protein [Thalassotalea ponticola]MDN3653778.1 hypothetical protein [Thalassotalea ponticola]